MPYVGRTPTPSPIDIDDLPAGSLNIPARNAVMTPDVLSQAESAEQGFGSTIYTGDGTAARSIDTGMDMASGDFGGLVWTKRRSAVADHRMYDTVRGVTKSLASSTITVETTTALTLTAFENTGFQVDTHAALNGSGTDFVAWSFQTNKKTTGLTNRNKAYTCHYNPNTNFSIVGYEGDGADGHEIPHHLGVKPELTIFKDRDSTGIWVVQGEYIGSPLSGDFLILNDTAAIDVAATLESVLSANTLSLNSSTHYNASADNHIMYNFASKSGICKIGKYIGTGAAGNYVSTEVDGGDAFKPQWIMVKKISATDSWMLVDSIRDARLSPDTSGAENATALLSFVDNGFICDDGNGATNNLNDEYIFMAFAETSIDSTRALTDYSIPTNPDQIDVGETLFSFATGFNNIGQTDISENVGPTNLILGAGYEDKKLYIYRDNTVEYGTNEVRPLYGINRPIADRSGVVSKADALSLDANSRTTAKHFDYESKTGVVLASSERTTYYAFNAFNKTTNDITSTVDSSWNASGTTGSLQYKYTEKRILKSWRIRTTILDTRTPKRFTIEGSNDGYNWTAIDSTYTSSDYVSNGISLWGDLQDTSGNSVAYNYIRINITANNGDTYLGLAELEFNTVIESDWFDVKNGVMKNNADTEIERVYIGECITDADGDIVSYEQSPVSKQHVTELEVHEKLIAHDEFIHPMACTAMIRFDGSQNPPLEHVNEGGLFVVDGGTGIYYVHVPLNINLDKATWESSQGYSQANISVTRSSKTSLRIIVRTDSGTYVDNNCSLNIFGGKS